MPIKYLDVPLIKLVSSDRLNIEEGFSDKCAICREDFVESKKTEEHIFPKWLLRKYNLLSQFFLLPNDTKIQYKHLTIPCCEICNGGIMSQWENAIKKASEIGYEGFIELDPNILAWWFYKIYYCLIVKCSTLRENIKDPQSKNIFSDKVVSQFKNVYFYMTELMSGTAFVGTIPYELYIFKTHNDNAFDFSENIENGVLYMRINDTLIVISLDGYGVFKEGYKNELNILSSKELIEPIEAEELLCKMLLYRNIYGFSTEHRQYIDSSGKKMESKIKEIYEINPYDRDAFFALMKNLGEKYGLSIKDVDDPNKMITFIKK